MSEVNENPYQAPTTELTEENSDELLQLSDPQHCSVGHGWTWITHAFQLFKNQPFMWIVMLIAMYVMQILISLVPVLGTIVSMFTGAIFAAGFAYASHQSDIGKNIDIGMLFVAFQGKAGSLSLMSLLYLVLFIIALIPAGLVIVSVVGLETLSAMGGSEGIPPEAGMLMLLAVLIAFLFMIPVVMAYFYAPTLIMLNDVAPLQALIMSFNGCLKNIIPLTWCSIIMSVLILISIIPLGLGLFVTVPLFILTIYTSYKSIFTR